MTILQWPEPAAGDIVWCHFPNKLKPPAKPGPALILTVHGEGPDFSVTVAYGTSQRTMTLHRGEFSILRLVNPAAYAAANLSYDTKFDLKQVVTLPFSSEWFSVPPRAPHGQVPKLGTLHPSLVRIVQAAYAAATQ